MENKRFIELLQFAYRWGLHNGEGRSDKNFSDMLETTVIKQAEITLRSERLNILDDFLTYLEKNGYVDTDARCEKPYAIDDFMQKMKC